MVRVPAPLARGVDLALEAGIVPSFSRVGHAVRSRVEGWEEVRTLPGAGRRIVVTGANSGLGLATAVALLQAGAIVVGTVRSDAKAEAAMRTLRDGLGPDVASRGSFEIADLGDLASVRRLAGRLEEAGEPITGLIHNAGAMFRERALTRDGLEQTYQLHVVAPFLLTASLLPTLCASAPARVITVTSGGMYAERLDVARLESPDDYAPATAYARAKRAQVALTQLAGERAAEPTGAASDDGADDPLIGFHAAHPGWALTPGVETSLPRFRRIAGPLLRTPEHGADTIAWLALTSTPLPSGRLWHDRRPRSAHKVPWTRTDRAEAQRLWDRVTRDAGIDPSTLSATAPAG